jgi:outer membrane immunogenic protein
MRKLLLATIAACALAAPAYASDLQMPTKAPPSGVLLTAERWTGFYGVGFGSWDFSSTIDAVSLGSSISDTTPVSSSGFGLGAGLGYRHQFGWAVLGAETDLAKEWVTGTSDVLTGRLGRTPFAVQTSEDLKWFGSTRAVAGVAFSPVLLYATGGLAYGGVGGTLDGSIGSSSLHSSFAASKSVNETRTGWTAGLGTEVALTQSWSVRAEWLYYDLGATTVSLPPGSATIPHKGNMLRAGLAYQF